MKRTACLMAAGMALLPLVAVAESPYSLYSPTRPQVEYTTSLSEQLSLRLGVSQFDPSLGSTYVAEPGADIPGMGVTASALVDWQLPAGGFRLTGGALYGDGSPYGGDGSAYSLGDGGSWSATDPYGLPDGRVTPYLGLGWGMETADEGRFGMQFDMGVMVDHGRSGGALRGSGIGYSGDHTYFGEQFDGLRYTPTFSADVYFRF